MQQNQALLPYRHISLHQRFYTDRERSYVEQALADGNLMAGGRWSKMCESWFVQNLGTASALMTHSCTAALEMTALSLDLKPGDEVILPSYTFVSTANAFALRGARLRFADSLPDHPNIGIDTILPLVSPRTRAIVVVHYGGMAVDLDPILALCHERQITLIEDAAHAIGSVYKGTPLGSFGDYSCFSFHDTKPVSCGEGGMLCIRDQDRVKPCETILEKGTNRMAFLRGEAGSYQWQSLGSSFAASQLQSAVLMAQLQQMQEILQIRNQIWQTYESQLSLHSNRYSLPVKRNYSAHNSSVFYLECENGETAGFFWNGLRQSGIQAAYHYPCLHQSPYMKDQQTDPCPHAESWSQKLIRLPIHTHMTQEDVHFVCNRLEELINEI